MAQRLKGLPVMWETWVRSLGREEGNGNLLQHSCLENPMDGGAWWATVHGVAKRRTRLSDFTSLHVCSQEESSTASHSEGDLETVVSKTLRLYAGCVHSDFCNINIVRSYLKKLNVKY